MKRKIITIFTILGIVIIPPMITNASTKLDNLDKSKISSHQESINTENIKQVNFISGIKYNSESNLNNMEIVSDYIDQIVCNVKAEDGTIYSIGVLNNTSQLNLSEYDERLKKQLITVNEVANSKLKYQDIEISKFILSKKQIPQPLGAESDSNFAISISNLENVDSVLDINNNISKTPKDLISNFDSLKSSSSYCYHDFDPNFGYKTWFNAITNSTSACKVSPTEPHMGDGNARYLEGRYWHPDYLSPKFREALLPNGNKERMILVSYDYDSDISLNWANIMVTDDNDSLEIEALLYNYPNAEASDRGYAFFTYDEITSWSGTGKSAYLDTPFADDPNGPVAMCVGVGNARDLFNAYNLYWSIQAEVPSDYICDGSHPQDGRFVLTAQRGYSILGDGSPFTVFQEEHEGTLKFALPEGKNWYADSYFDQYNEQSYINTANWYFHITEDNLPVKNELWD
ncbi:MAG: hypothetical protein UDG86_08475 [Lachnospiraceae bacterium]|jgi:hypothetical protein|nr:hypothetical protein [Lachnospiraceae bacterium]